jgi:hypothetical protein
MMGNCWLPGSTTTGWYLGVVVLDLVTWGSRARVFYELLFAYWAHVLALVEECYPLSCTCVDYSM